MDFDAARSSYSGVDRDQAPSASRAMPSSSASTSLRAAWDAAEPSGRRIGFHRLARQRRAAEDERFRAGVELAGRADVLAGALEHAMDVGIQVDHQTLAFDRELQIVAHVVEL